MGVSKLRKSAQGRECQVRIPGVCNGNPETTVLAHLNGGGMGMKRSDIHGAYCCSACHDEIDGRTRVVDNDIIRNDSDIIRKIYHYQAVIRTQEIMLREGLIKV